MNDDFRWSVRVAAPDGNHATAFVRRNTIQMGVPVSFDQSYEDVTALEHFLAAVAGDVVTGLQLRAKRRRVAIDNIEATVQCTLNNPLTFLEVVGEVGDPGVSELRVMVYISTTADEVDVQQLWHDTLRRSPMIQTLKEAVELEVEFKIVL